MVSKKVTKSLYGEGFFYPAKQKFHLFRTCNIWVSNLLRSAGVEVSPSRSFTSGQLKKELDKVVEK